ncbi:7718_t:CDS:2 [Ambispora gerdemannii]|uniref:7718_t:CDS:1 n=1 Tax=Ambispora gerdemannii TaxID=144530 RepID=A0A9N8V1M2_9GLOM|nr:7718_t:CDS:2 [Ambispora gerdemannii]
MSEAQKDEGLSEKILHNALRWKGTVVPKIFPSALICTIVAVIVTILYEKTSVKISIPQAFIPVLGFVVGRRAWSTMEVAIRAFARLTWVNVGRKNDQAIEKETVRDIIEMKTVINLLLGFAIGTKHYLREKEGSDQPDLKSLIGGIQTKPSGCEKLEDPNRAQKSPKHKKKPHERRNCQVVENHNIPLEISLYLSSYIQTQVEKKLDSPVITAMLNSLNTMVDCLTTFERILRSPIPVAYSTHLSQTVWVYCLTLPLQFVQFLHWVTIPFVFFSSGVLLGIEKIGGEIENPFGKDENDLNLDEFCERLGHELELITSLEPSNIKILAFSQENTPFSDVKITGEKAEKFGIDKIRSLLSGTHDENNEKEASAGIFVKIE